MADNDGRERQQLDNNLLVPLLGRGIYPNNLPVHLTPLLGRERVVAEVCALLQRPGERLVTLTGTGGVGKTRLGLAVATRLQGVFVDGIYLVSLAPLSDPDLVVPTVAEALGLSEARGQPLLDLMKAYVRDKHLLLLLDNFEQVVAAAPRLSDLLVCSPVLKILVTSREVLHVSGEREFPVPPLELPDFRSLPESEALSQYASVALFTQRAQAIKPDFQVTDVNAAAVAEICVRLDGLPLAIELAAARIKLLPPRALLTRLEQRLHVLTSGARDVPARQQTLRNTIEWSYKLLNAEEQGLFRRLSVFVGGGTLQAVEEMEISVALDNDKKAGSVLDGVASLIDRNLLRQTEETGEEPRLVMLETICEYALEALAASGEAETVRRAHATYYLQFAKKAAKEIPGANQGSWLKRLEQEHDNLRAALNWLQKQQEQEMFLQLAVALGDFWSHTVYLSEGRRFLEHGLVSSSAVQASTRAKALYVAGALAADQHERGRAVELCQESLGLFRELGDKRGIAASLRVVSNDALMRGDMKAAADMLAEALMISRESGDRREICFALMTLGSNAYYEGDYVKARRALEECLSHCRELRDAGGTGYALFFLAGVSYAQGDDAIARARAEEGLAIFKEASIQGGRADTLIFLAHVISSQGDQSTARALAEEGLALSKELEGKRGVVEGLRCLGLITFRQGNHDEAYACYEEGVRVLEASDQQDAWTKVLLATCLAGLGSVVAAQEHLVWAVRLWSVAQALPPDPAWLAMPIERVHYEQSMATVRAQLGEEAFAAAWVEGRAMMLEQVLAVQDTELPPQHLPSAPPATPPQKSVTPYPADLTRREVEVLRLVAQGLTDAVVAERLVISPHTVHAHISSVYSKLGVNTRSAATRYAFEHNLT